MVVQKHRAEHTVSIAVSQLLLRELGHNRGPVTGKLPISPNTNSSIVVISAP